MEPTLSESDRYGLVFGTALQSLYDRLKIKPYKDIKILIVYQNATLTRSSLVIIIFYYHN
jgi:hypothetical protein